MPTPPRSRIFVYARLDSSRFPRKALAPVIGDVGLLEMVLGRVSRVKHAAVCLLTSDRPLDDELCELAKSASVEVVRGSAEDLVERTLSAIEETGCDYLCRVNGDSPLVDVELLEHGHALVKEGRDFVTNLNPRSFPYGVAVEWVRAQCYKELSQDVREGEKEHVTQHLYRLWSELRGTNLLNPQGDWTEHRFTVDSLSDLVSLRKRLTSAQRDLNDVRYFDIFAEQEIF